MSAPLPEPVQAITSPFAMSYTYVAGVGRSVFLRGLKDKKLLSRRCPSCRLVYAPTPEQCARCLVELEAPRELPGTGVVETFCVVNFPFPGQTVEPPYVVGYIRLDGADSRLMHFIGGAAPGDVRAGMQVAPVWVGDSALEPSMASIRHFAPIAKDGRTDA